MLRSPLEHGSTRGSALAVHLLGQVDWAECLALQRRLVYEAGEGLAAPVVLICEHPPLVTIGRGGSRGHLRLTDAELHAQRLEIRRVARGGGCILHLPGQLAIYPIVSLEDHRLSVGAFVGGLQLAIQETLIALRYPALVRPGTAGIWGRTGQLAALGVAVRQGVAYHGAFLNVSPELRLFRHVQTDPRDPAPMSSLLAERSRPARMSAVRAELVPRLATALGCPRYHLYTGHPLLPSLTSAARGTAAHPGP